MKWVLPMAMFLHAMLLSADVEDAARQVLAAKCGACHGPAAMGGLRLDSSAGLRKGGKSGRPVTEILLLAVRGGEGAVKAMPPGGKLKPTEIDALEKWLADGAAWSGGPAGH